MVQVAEDTGDSGLKCITVRMVEEKKALKEYNCPVVSVLSDGAFGRRRHRGRAFSSCVVQEEVDVESFKVVRQITHPEMKRCSRWLAS